MALVWTAVLAWWRAGLDRRERRAEKRYMGVCPDCGVYLTVHRWIRHGVDPAAYRTLPQRDE